MGAFTGRDVALQFAIADESANPVGLTFLDLGMLRGKSLQIQWDTVDATADDSAAFTKENLVTFKSVTFSGDGVARTEAAFNQAAMQAHVMNPPGSTQNQPKVWLKLIMPTGTYQGPFIVNEYSTDSPYADVVTFSISAMSNGAPVFTPV